MPRPGSLKTTYARSIIPTEEQIRRFESFVNKTADANGCHIWMGTVMSKADPYGTFSFRHFVIRAHRFAYCAYYGPIPKGMSICHTCDNPICVNPAHLWLGTHLQNVRDMVSKGRHGASKNHKLTHQIAQEGE